MTTEQRLAAVAAGITAVGAAVAVNLAVLGAVQIAQEVENKVESDDDAEFARDRLRRLTARSQAIRRRRRQNR